MADEKSQMISELKNLKFIYQNTRAANNIHKMTVQQIRNVLSLVKKNDSKSIQNAKQLVVDKSQTEQQSEAVRIQLDNKQLARVISELQNVKVKVDTGKSTNQLKLMQKTINNLVKQAQQGSPKAKQVLTNLSKVDLSQLKNASTVLKRIGKACKDAGTQIKQFQVEGNKGSAIFDKYNRNIEELGQNYKHLKDSIQSNIQSLGKFNNESQKIIGKIAGFGAAGIVAAKGLSQIASSFDNTIKSIIQYKNSLQMLSASSNDLLPGGSKQLDNIRRDMNLTRQDTVKFAQGVASLRGTTFDVKDLTDAMKGMQQTIGKVDISQLQKLQQIMKTVSKDQLDALTGKSTGNNLNTSQDMSAGIYNIAKSGKIDEFLNAGASGAFGSQYSKNMGVHIDQKDKNYTKRSQDVKTAKETAQNTLHDLTSTFSQFLPYIQGSFQASEKIVSGVAATGIALKSIKSYLENALKQNKNSGEKQNKDLIDTQNKINSQQASRDLENKDATKEVTEKIENVESGKLKTMQQNIATLAKQNTNNHNNLGGKESSNRVESSASQDKPEQRPSDQATNKQNKPQQKPSSQSNNQRQNKPEQRVSDQTDNRTTSNRTTNNPSRGKFKSRNKASRFSRIFGNKRIRSHGKLLSKLKIPGVSILSSFISKGGSGGKVGQFLRVAEKMRGTGRHAGMLGKIASRNLSPILDTVAPRAMDTVRSVGQFLPKGMTNGLNKSLGKIIVNPKLLNPLSSLSKATPALSKVMSKSIPVVGKVLKVGGKFGLKALGPIMTAYAAFQGVREASNLGNKKKETIQSIGVNSKYSTAPTQGDKIAAFGGSFFTNNLGSMVKSLFVDDREEKERDNFAATMSGSVAGVNAMSIIGNLIEGFLTAGPMGAIAAGAASYAAIKHNESKAQDYDFWGRIYDFNKETINLERANASRQEQMVRHSLKMYKMVDTRLQQITQGMYSGIDQSKFQSAQMQRDNSIYLGTDNNQYQNQSNTMAKTSSSAFKKDMKALSQTRSTVVSDNTMDAQTKIILLNKLLDQEITLRKKWQQQFLKSMSFENLPSVIKNNLQAKFSQARIDLNNTGFFGSSDINASQTGANLNRSFDNLMKSAQAFSDNQKRMTDFKKQQKQYRNNILDQTFSKDSSLSSSFEFTQFNTKIADSLKTLGSIGNIKNNEDLQSLFKNVDKAMKSEDKQEKIEQLDELKDVFSNIANNQKSTQEQKINAKVQIDLIETMKKQIEAEEQLKTKFQKFSAKASSFKNGDNVRFNNFSEQFINKLKKSGAIDQNYNIKDQTAFRDAYNDQRKDTFTKGFVADSLKTNQKEISDVFKKNFKNAGLLDEKGQLRKDLNEQEKKKMASVTQQSIDEIQSGTFIKDRVTNGDKAMADAFDKFTNQNQQLKKVDDSKQLNIPKTMSTLSNSADAAFELARKLGKKTKDGNINEAARKLLEIKEEMKKVKQDSSSMNDPKKLQKLRDSYAQAVNRLNVSMNQIANVSPKFTQSAAMFAQINTAQRESETGLKGDTQNLQQLTSKMKQFSTALQNAIQAVNSDANVRRKALKAQMAQTSYVVNGWKGEWNKTTDFDVYNAQIATQDEKISVLDKILPKIKEMEDLRGKTSKEVSENMSSSFQNEQTKKFDSLSVKGSDGKDSTFKFADYNKKMFALMAEASQQKDNKDGKSKQDYIASIIEKMGKENIQAQKQLTAKFLASKNQKSQTDLNQKQKKQLDEKRRMLANTHSAASTVAKAGGDTTMAMLQIQNEKRNAQTTKISILKNLLNNLKSLRETSIKILSQAKHNYHASAAQVEALNMGDPDKILDHTVQAMQGVQVKYSQQEKLQEGRVNQAQANFEKAKREKQKFDPKSQEGKKAQQDFVTAQTALYKAKQGLNNIKISNTKQITAAMQAGFNAFSSNIRERIQTINVQLDFAQNVGGTTDQWYSLQNEKFALLVQQVEGLRKFVKDLQQTNASQQDKLKARNRLAKAQLALSKQRIGLQRSVFEKQFGAFAGGFQAQGAFQGYNHAAVFGVGYGINQEGMIVSNKDGKLKRQGRSTRTLVRQDKFNRYQFKDRGTSTINSLDQKTEFAGTQKAKDLVFKRQVDGSNAVYDNRLKQYVQVGRSVKTDAKGNVVYKTDAKGNKIKNDKGQYIAQEQDHTTTMNTDNVTQKFKEIDKELQRKKDAAKDSKTLQIDTLQVVRDILDQLKSMHGSFSKFGSAVVTNSSQPSGSGKNKDVKRNNSTSASSSSASDTKDSNQAGKGQNTDVKRNNSTSASSSSASDTKDSNQAGKGQNNNNAGASSQQKTRAGANSSVDKGNNATPQTQNAEKKSSSEKAKDTKDRQSKTANKANFVETGDMTRLNEQIEYLLKCKKQDKEGIVESYDARLQAGRKVQENINSYESAKKKYESAKKKQEKRNELLLSFHKSSDNKLPDLKEFVKYGLITEEHSKKVAKEYKNAKTSINPNSWRQLLLDYTANDKNKDGTEVQQAETQVKTSKEELESSIGEFANKDGNESAIPKTDNIQKLKSYVTKRNKQNEASLKIANWELFEKQTAGKQIEKRRKTLQWLKKQQASNFDILKGNNKDATVQQQQKAYEYFDSLTVQQKKASGITQTDLKNFAKSYGINSKGDQTLFGKNNQLSEISALSPMNKLINKAKKYNDKTNSAFKVTDEQVQESLKEQKKDPKKVSTLSKNIKKTEMTLKSKIDRYTKKQKFLLEQINQDPKNVKLLAQLGKTTQKKEQAQKDFEEFQKQKGKIEPIVQKQQQQFTQKQQAQKKAKEEATEKEKKAKEEKYLRLASLNEKMNKSVSFKDAKDFAMEQGISQEQFKKLYGEQGNQTDQQKTNLAGIKEHLQKQNNKMILEEEASRMYKERTGKSWDKASKKTKQKYRYRAQKAIEQAVERVDRMKAEKDMEEMQSIEEQNNMQQLVAGGELSDQENNQGETTTTTTQTTTNKSTTTTAKTKDKPTNKEKNTKAEVQSNPSMQSIEEQNNMQQLVAGGELSDQENNQGEKVTQTFFDRVNKHAKEIYQDATGQSWDKAHKTDKDIWKHKAAREIHENQLKEAEYYQEHKDEIESQFGYNPQNIVPKEEYYIPEVANSEELSLDHLKQQFVGTSGVTTYDQSNNMNGLSQNIAQFIQRINNMNQNPANEMLRNSPTGKILSLTNKNNTNQHVLLLKKD